MNDIMKLINKIDYLLQDETVNSQLKIQLLEIKKEIQYGNTNFISELEIMKLLNKFGVPTRKEKNNG